MRVVNQWYSAEREDLLKMVSMELVTQLITSVASGLTLSSSRNPVLAACGTSRNGMSFFTSLHYTPPLVHTVSSIFYRSTSGMKEPRSKTKSCAAHQVDCNFVGLRVWHPPKSKGYEPLPLPQRVLFGLNRDSLKGSLLGKSYAEVG
jgi:hypothetical protein